MLCLNNRCSEAKKQNGKICTSWDECAFFLADHTQKLPVKKKDTYRTEAQEQEIVVNWCKKNKIDVVHIPNEGKRSVITGAMQKKMGLQSGFPDLFFPIIKNGHGGLFIEMKSQKKSAKVSERQKNWISRLNYAGYKATVCNGAEEAINEIRRYMGIE